MLFIVFNEVFGLAQGINPTVFISYSYDNQEHVDWVEKLALKMRIDGVNVIFDKWHIETGDSVPFSIEQSILKSDYVVIVCTPNYKYKADNRLGGVGYEDSIITGEMVRGVNKTKYLPVIRKGTALNAIPIFLIDKRYENFTNIVEFDTDINYNALLSKIHNIKRDLPRIGDVPVERIKATMNKNIYDNHYIRDYYMGTFINQLKTLLKLEENIVRHRK